MKLYLSILLVLVFAFGIAGQTFSKDWEKIPVTFTGNDFETIFYALLESPQLKEKDEFETTTQYNERFENLSKMNLGNGLTADKSIIFVYRTNGDTSSINDLSSRYDADSQTLNISLNTRPFNAYKKINGTLQKYLLYATTVKTRLFKEEGKYTGKNSFGTEAVVTKYKSDSYNLAIANIEDFLNGEDLYLGRGIKIKIPLIPEKAKILKGSLSTLFIVNLVSPFTTIEGVELKATLDKPREIKGYDKVLIGNVQEIWIFNSLTGEIAAKIKSNQIKESSSKVFDPLVKSKTDSPIEAKTISGGVLNGKAIYLPKPEYPKEAKKLRASGTVVVEILLDENGDVVSADAISGHEALRKVAQTAALSARFAPTYLSGQPVKVRGIINFNFTP